MSAALLSLAAIIFTGGCAGTSVVDQWRDESLSVEKPDRIAVIAALPDALMRQAIEVDIVDMLNKKGANAVVGARIPGLTGGIRGEIDVTKATEALNRANVDGIIVIFYSGSGISDTYERSDYWAQHVGSGMGYSWGRPYFTNVYTIRQGPGYADTRNVVYVESSYYDMDLKAPVWRIVTQSKDTEYNDSGAQVGTKIIAQMSANRLL
jgi:hypothetical protein